MEKEFLICQYPNGESTWFGKIPYGYDLNGLTPKEFIIEQLLNVFKQEPDEVYWIKLDPGGYYACCYEEYLFKTDKGIYFFSMQVHDWIIGIWNIVLFKKIYNLIIKKKSPGQRNKN